MKNALRSHVAVAAAIVVSSLVSSAMAQTSGSLTPTVASYNYSTAPWVITSGVGTYPDGGGTATLLPGVGVTPGTLFTGSAITVNVSPTLSQINYNSPFSLALVAGTGTSIVGSGSGLTLNTVLTPANTPTFFQLPNTISSPISGGGTAGVTKTGAGSLTLTGANTYTGGTHFNGGIVAVSSTAAVGDGVFGATGAGNGLSFNGGSLFVNVTSGLTSARDILLEAGGGTILTNTAATLSGVISGPGSLNNAGFGAVNLTLTNTNTYQGATINASNVSATVLSGNGSIANSSAFDLTGALTLSNTATNLTNRLNDTAAVTLRGAVVTSTGNATASSSETIGAVTAASSFSTLLVTPGATASNSLTMASLARTNNSTLAFRGAGLGQTPGNGVANIYSSVTPTLTGGAGTAGSTTQSILPWAIGNATNASLAGSSLVTYDVNGFRPLAVAEYATAFGGSDLDNVRLTATTAAGAGVTANAVVFAPAAAATLSGGTINITSGAFLYSPTATATGTVSAGLNFGAAEGVITNTSLLNFSGPIAGSGGVTYTSPTSSTPSTPTIALSGGLSSYTGNTTINSGSVGFSGTVAAAGSASIFGNNGTIVLAGGVNTATITASGAATLNRDLQSVGTGVNYVASSGTAVFNLNGNVTLSNSLYIYGNSNSATAAFTWNGNITGSGGIVDTTLGYSIFNGNNDFSGGVTLPGSSTFVAGSNTAFGTGPIYITGAGTVQGSGTTARTLNNVLFLSASPTFGGTAPLTFTNTTNLNGANRTLTLSNTALTTLSGSVINGAITKAGTGAIAFNSASGNTFSGGFINTGVAATSSAIYVNNTSGSGLGIGGVSVGATSATVFSTLAGNFTIAGNTSIGGRLSPGNGTGLTAATAGTSDIGTANFGSALTLSSATTSSATLELAGESSFDKINVAGLFTLAGTINVATINGFVAQPGMSFDLVDWGTITVGTFALNTAGLAIAPGATIDTSNFSTNGTIVITPEPSSLALVGMLGAGLLRRRRR